MTPRATYRGQPLVALLLLLGGWVAARWMILDAQAPRFPVAEPTRIAAGAAAPAPVAEAADPEMLPAAAIPAGFRLRLPVDPPRQYDMPPVRFDTTPPRYDRYDVPLRPSSRAPAPLVPAFRLAPNLRSLAPHPGARASAAPVPMPIATAHQMLWMAALTNLPIPAAMTARPAAAPSPAVAAVSGLARPFRDPRWSADAWLLLRRGGNGSPAGGLAPPSYGASQAGAVVRYRLAPQSAHRPALYLRGSAALNGSREREAAVGISARPIAGVPVVFAAEARLNGQPSGTRARPAAFAYTELPPIDLPLGTRAEFYGQAGYVGGTFATAFADGQFRVDRRVVQLGRGELRAGGGAWGGAQKGASRLDVGPTATLGVPLGGTAGARVGVDWRFRVAGNAEPSSGPALTLSAGF